MTTKKNMKIVIVEDDPYYNKALTRYVQHICNPDDYPEFNFEISSYLTARDCFDNYENDTDIMILDYILINDDEQVMLTGEDIINEVKRYNPECRFIMITEQKNPATTEKLYRLGVTAYIDKDLSDKNRLGAILQDLIASKREKKELVQP